MLSLKKYESEIISKDVTGPLINGNYKHWYGYHDMPPEIGCKIKIVKNRLGERFTRKDIHKLYKDKKLDIVTKFLAAMIWGYEHEEGHRRDARGPSRVAKMFEDFEKTKDILESAHSDFDEAILSKSYKLLNSIPKCGQSFLTKHLYFLGKASNPKSYPVILDARVAAGLLKLSLKDSYCLEIFKAQTYQKFSAYWRYLQLTKYWADKFVCEPEQIECFLFSYSKNK